MFAERPKKLSAASLKCCFDRLSKNRKDAKSNAEQGHVIPPESVESVNKKPRNNEALGVFEGMYAHALASAQKREKRLQRHQDANMAECTFKPDLSKPSPASLKLSKEALKKHKKPPKVKDQQMRMRMREEEPIVPEVVQPVDNPRGELIVLEPPQQPKRLGTFVTALTSLEHFSTVLLQLQGQGGSDSELQKHDVKEDDVKEEDSKVDFVLPDNPADAFCSICREGPSTHMDDSEHDVGVEDDDDSGAMIQLSSCQHHAHLACLKRQLAARWAGKKISFRYLQCGECRAPLAHDTLARLLTPHHRLQKEVEALCVQQASVDDLIPDLALKLQVDREETTAQCMAALSCFMCSQCSEPFCGGRVDCAQDDDLDISVLKCPACAFDVPRKATEKVATVATHVGWLGKCQAHGYKFAIYKCDSCCSVATWDCRSNHYCTRCHDRASSSKDYKCPAETDGVCPLGIPHPPNKPGVHGTVDDGFVIGCSKCFLLGGSGQEAEAQKELEGFELATDSSSRNAAINWKDRF